MTLRLNGSTSGYTEIDAPAVAGSNTLTLPTGNGASGQVLSTNGSGALSWVNRPILQVVNTQTGAYASGTAIIPNDDTIPQITEGTEFMTLSITPANANNKLLIFVIATLASSVNGQLTASLFQDSTANALATNWIYQVATGPSMIAFNHFMTAGTVSATTFKVRGGGSSAGTTSFNGSAGVRYFGGSMASSITIMEIAA